MATPAVQATGLTRWFGEDEAKTYAVREASFEASFGQMLYLVGPSGSGKTTLLSMISGILRPSGGTVAVQGTDLWSLGADRLADFRLHTVGFVFQDFHLFPRLTAVENVAIPLILKRWAWDKALAESMRHLEVVGLQGRAHLAPVKLSGGEQQRVAIARAIASAPDVLILDEPTASLDGDTGRRIIEFVKANVLTPARAILVVTHDDRIFSYADRILHMEDGRIVGTQEATHAE